ncbi:MAG: hypothetical protein ABR570_11700 [Burkholderiales bacterium]
MAVATPYHERRGGERRRMAYPALFGAEGVRVSWGGIFGGVLVAVGLLLLLAALGVAVGITAIDPAETPLGSLGTGAGIWAGVSLLLALFVGGLVSTRIGATFDGSTGFFSGFLVWIVSLLLVAYLAASGVSSLASGAFSLMGGPQQIVEQVGEKAQEMTQNLPALQQKAQEAKPQASRAAWITFGALLLSLGAAVIGAMAGRRRAPRPITP